ncbi:MAG: protein translocase subunit SecD [Gammaproteobacteria bacterium]|nr:protein translocase subunit SecD [Gammaproteobacteria bacterium]NIR84849.1 protein translocase subunit SecD [Gammaproteobacteria bacterium]NIR91621.1 protein translocase subunit SecD [Gammaproteobacteria bacterium]NIU05900.1 protein translocase subunit SecD [Gammaproteobacteria bacterium]NIV76814.1 protein translocase subunit SecD [Gammaproteobacteria bacterium]
MNQYPAWKYLLVLAVLLIGAVYALPNVYGEDPAVQISPGRSAEIGSALRQRAAEALEAQGLAYKSIELAEQALLVRFRDTEAQLEAKDVLTDALGDQYVVALNLAPTTPEGLRALGAQPMYLGLDLRGGVHFLMEVDMEAAVEQAEERYLDELRSMMRENKVRYLTVANPEDEGVRIKFRSPDERAQARELIEEELRELTLRAEDRGGDAWLVAELTESEVRSVREFALEQNLTTLRNRVNELGVAEPVIQQQGENRIVVQLPGVQDTARAKDILGATATLEFRLVDEEHDPFQAERTGRVPPASELFQTREGRPILLERRVILTGEHITDARSGLAQDTGSPEVSITLDGQGGRMMRNATRERVGDRMAVVFIETKTEMRRVDGELVRETERTEEVINVATIREQLSQRFRITGLESTREARDLALLLRAGALAAPVYIVEERTVGPSLGRENIEQGFNSVVIGLALVLAFMALYYRIFGLIADLALVVNLVLIVAVLSMLQATLTLPGIAGIVLTVGMAVDANVLIFERIREEVRNGNSPQASIHAGYEKALSTIADANITTFIAAIVLFSFGTGPIKGFAVTLSIGILTSMFTAIMGTRSVVNLLYGGRRISRLAI